jgi:hypothetical protein
MSTATDTHRIEVVMDHLVNLTDQVRRLADLLRAVGIAIPADVGTLGLSSDEACIRLMNESFEARWPGKPKPWDEH